MTVQDFIVIYNETFKFLDEKYGIEDVKDLWATISNQWCSHLDELVREKGLEGMLEYWGGDQGTLGRENAVYNVTLKNGIFEGIINRCPSVVGELVDRGKDIYHGKLSYCDHCLALYGPIANKYGYEMTWNIEYDKSDVCTGKCSWKSFKK